MPNVRHLKSVLAERLGLSLTCWMVYHESIHLLYTKQTFHFPSGIALPALKANLSTSKFHLIRDIKLTFNMADLDSQRCNNRRPKDDIVQNPWRILPFMRGLRVLNVEIQITSQDLVHGTTKGLAQRLSFLLEPAAAVEQVDVFDIRVTDKEFGIAEGFLEVLRNRVGKRSVPFRILGEE